MFTHLCSESGTFKHKNQWRSCVCLSVNKITFTPVPSKFMTLWKQVLHTRPTSCLSRDKQSHYCYIQAYKLFCNHSTENTKQGPYIRVSETLHRPHRIRVNLLHSKLLFEYTPVAKPNYTRDIGSQTASLLQSLLVFN